MNVLPDSKRAAILKALTEGCSVRATARMVGVSKTTILKLLVEAGQFCALYHDKVVRGLACTRVEADEIWAFVGSKQRNAHKPGQGDIWTFTALCADSKLIVSWYVGHRVYQHATAFMDDVRSRLTNRVQLTTDGHHMYLTAVESAFGYGGVDYAMLVKKYGLDPAEDRRKYSPAVCVGTMKEHIMGKPDMEQVSTSYVERQNLTIRLNNRRHTRLTNAFSRKVENHEHAMALHFFVYNFCRSHTTLTKARGGIHTTPAMAAGITDLVWKMEDVLGLMDANRPIG
ncbi:MAG TPA: IS1 family transposase [Gemmatimonadales bacterium]